MFEYGFGYALAKLVSKILSFPCMALWVIFETYYLRRFHWQNALLLMLIVIAWNSILKFIIHVPLTPPMTGFAIPSGHMHTALAFWGYIGFSYHKRATGILMLALMPVFGWSLIKLHYHSLLDVSCAYLAFVIELWFMKNIFEQRPNFALEALSFLVVLSLILGMPNMPIYTLCGMTGFILAQTQHKKDILWLISLWAICMPGAIIKPEDIIIAATTFAANLMLNFQNIKQNADSCYYRS